MRLAGKLNVIFLFFSLIPLLLLGYFVYDYGRQGVIAETYNNLELTTTLKRGEFKRWLEADQRHLKELAQRPLVREYASVLMAMAREDPAFQTAYQALETDHMAPALAEQRGFLNLSLLRPDTGVIVFSTSKKFEGQIRGAEAFFQKGKKGTYVQNVELSAENQGPVMHVSTPVTDRAGRLIAVLAAHIDWTEMSRIMMHGLDVHPSQGTFLVNTASFFVTESRFSSDVTLKRATFTQAVQDCLAHNDGQGLYNDHRGVPVLGVYQWMPERELCIITEINQAEALAPVSDYGRIVLIIGALVGVVAVLSGYCIARLITGPLHELVKGAEHVGRGELDYRVKGDKQDEIGLLARSFNEMAGNLQEITASRNELNREIDERRLAEEQLRWEAQVTAALSETYVPLISQSSTIEQIAQTILAKSRELTRSAHGFVSTIDPRNGDNIGHTLTDMHTGECTVTKDKIRFPRGADGHYGGLWGYSLNIRKPFYTNSPESHPAGTGIPAGHVPLKNFLSVPVLLDRELVGQINLANKDGAYGDHDLVAINRLAEFFALAVQRKTAEESLHKYKRIVAASREHISFLDTNYVYQQVNDAYLEAHGRLREDIVGQSVADLLGQKVFAEKIKEKLDRALDGEIVHYESWFEFPGQGQRFMGVTYFPYLDEDKRVAGVVVNSRDITERKEAERALQKAHDELEKKVIERTADLITTNELLRRESSERKRTRSLLEHSNALLNAINHAQSMFIAETGADVLFDELLKNLLELTASEYGFIGEVFHEADGTPYLKTHAITDISWNQETREFYEQNAPTGFEFRNMQTLFGRVMTSGQAVIANDPANDPRRGGLPDGHPSLNAFCGLPLIREDILVGMIGMANRPGGYDNALCTFLEPYINTCVRIMEAYKSEQRRKEAEASIALNFRSQAVLNEILRLSLEGGSLAEILQCSLNILLSLPWLAIEAKGCVFLADENSDDLVMIAQQDMPAATRKKCSQVVWDTCLCGRAAQTGVLQFVDRVDDRHDIICGEMGPHGHYCVPIRSGETFVGVLNVYLKEGHVSIPQEERFLESAASTLANIIMGKRAEDQIRQSKTMLQTVFDGIPDPLVMVDLDMNIQMINKASWRYYQVDRSDQIIGRSCFLGNREMFFPENISDTVATASLDREIIFERPGFMDAERLEKVAIYPVCEEGEERSGSIIRISDITENRKMQEHLIRADRLSSLGQLSGGIAHEIRNPLAGISLFTDILGDEEKFVLKEQQKEIIGDIKDNINKIDEIIRRVLDFARPPANSLSSVDLNNLLRGIITLWQAKFSKAAIQLDLSLGPAVLYVRIDPLGLQQVIHNLILNATEAMENGGVLEISTNPGRSLHDKDRMVAFVRVKDSGPGIPPEQASEIFNPFYTTKATGTGLGLAISHQIIEQVGGAIAVESEPGKGTAFIIELPLSQGDD